MHISRVDIFNYRLLRQTSISLEKDLSLIIGKNNCGKTSFLSVLSKCVGSKSEIGNFDFNDFSMSFQKKLYAVVEGNESLYARVSGVRYEEFINLYTYLEGYSPFSTQHRIKGEEYKNVFVILDNGKWNNYNFEYLFNPAHKNCKPSVLTRTQKLFYVCCTRAMENLVVYCEKPTPPMIETAKEWFGENNYEKI